MDNSKNNAFENEMQKLKPAVKTTYLDTGEKTEIKSLILGIIFLFLCVFAGCVGLILCVADSFQLFSLDISLFDIMFKLALSLAFFTLIYFLPSKIFTFLAFVCGAGFFSYYVISRWEDITNAGYSFLNFCIYRIEQAGYSVGTLGTFFDRNRALNTSPEDISMIIFLASVFFAAFFSYIMYSRKNIIYNIFLSVAVIFPGFFYGLIPAYFSFTLVAAMWVAHFTMNMYDSGYILYLMGKENTVPEKKLDKQKFKLFKKQYKKNIKSIKSEISKIMKSPNRDENTLRLDKLARQLEAVSNSKSDMMFLKFYKLDKPKFENKKNKNLKSAGIQKIQQDRGEKQDNPKLNRLNTLNTFGEEITEKENSKNKKKNKNQNAEQKFVSPLKMEKRRLREESKNKKNAEKLQHKKDKKELRDLNFSERTKIKLRENMDAKKKNAIKSGYGGIFAFAVAMCAVMVVQPFIRPDAKFNLSAPERIMSFLTNTIEYFLVGSDSSVYGGYSGGMGGGYLQKSGGVRFQNKPILQLNANTKSRVIYLRGWIGGEYDSRMWMEADKSQIDKYSELQENIFALSEYNYTEETFFKWFTENMQTTVGASSQRRMSELKGDRVSIEHLVSGGRRAFLPYFYVDYTSQEINFKKNADMNVEIKNSLFKYPSYTVDFYSVDNILNRAQPHAVEDLQDYLEKYKNSLNDLSFWSPEKIEKEFPGAYIVYYDEFAQQGLEENYWPVPYLYDIYNKTNKNDKNNGNGENADNIDNADNVTYYNTIISKMQFEKVIAVPHEYTLKLREVQDSAQFWEGRITSAFYDSEMAYNNYVREYYLSIPETLPQEVIDLAKDITAGLNTDYEKALAIEKYLAENYTYTLTPRDPYDMKADFVFNFLFDLEEGYCTHYATSMVIMLRSLDIPARYVEGYLADMSKKTRNTEDGRDYVIVYDYHGHAWPEVYLRGIGWIPFEPTAAYNDDSEEDKPYEYTPPARIPGPDGMMLMNEPISDEDWDDEIGENTVRSNLSKILFVILLFIFAAVVIYIINYIVNSKRLRYFKLADTNSAVVKMLEYVLTFLKYCGFVMYNEESLKNFAKRISPAFSMMRPGGWEKITDIMQKARYSMHEISEEERLYVYDFIDALRTECLKKLKVDLKLKLRFVYFVL